MNWSQWGKTHCLYNKDIKSTKSQITSNIKKGWNTLKLIAIFEVMIDTFHSIQFILSFHLSISMSLTWKMGLLIFFSWWLWVWVNIWAFGLTLRCSPLTEQNCSKELEKNCDFSSNNNVWTTFCAFFGDHFKYCWVIFNMRDWMEF